ncbi:MAG: hypothetical protein ACLFQ8_02865 [Candidatus Aenigmatarchaeota archaeon]
MKEQNINQEDWDYLIVLDACRYDAFEKVHSKYLEGELEKRLSKGSSTTGWLENSFPGDYDYLYISSNPFVNSLGHSLSDISTGYYSSWRATEHFGKIVDSWNLDWDHDLETVTPEKLTKRAVKHIEEDDSKDRRTIIHYMQPHRPYLEGDVEIENIGLERAVTKVSEDQGFFEKLRAETLSVLYHVWKRMSVPMKYRIKKLLGYETKTEKFIINGGGDKIVEWYMQNLELALKWIEKLLPHLDGEVVITADHGEAFGENGIWWHEYREHVPILLEVPWFRVDMDKYKEEDGKVEPVEEENEKEDKIKDKLKKLGYA